MCDELIGSEHELRDQPGHLQRAIEQYEDAADRHEDHSGYWHSSTVVSPPLRWRTIVTIRNPFPALDDKSPPKSW